MNPDKNPFARYSYGQKLTEKHPEKEVVYLADKAKDRPLYDFFNREIRIGDEVAYSSAYGRSMTRGVISEIWWIEHQYIPYKVIENYRYENNKYIPAVIEYANEINISYEPKFTVKKWQEHAWKDYDTGEDKTWNGWRRYHLVTRNEKDLVKVI